MDAVISHSFETQVNATCWSQGIGKENPKSHEIITFSLCDNGHRSQCLLALKAGYNSSAAALE